VLKLKKIILSILLIFAVVSSLVIAAEPERFKVSSSIHPKYLLEELKLKPHLLYFTIGNFYYKIGKVEKAQEMYDKALSLKKDLAAAYNNIGLIHYNNEDYDKSIAQFKKIIEFDRENSNAYYSQGIVYFKQENYLLAIESFTKAVEFDSKNPNKNFDLAQSYVAQFRKDEKDNIEDYSYLEEALKHFKIVKDIDSNFPNLENNVKILDFIISQRNSLIG
jgi:tetratricopeptide (TPR) repeat protein